ncbi:hypothetical protein EJ08DRAFT_58077 [Tothia fuscella]|uniref:SAM domain-containing protein n=1 Tax=Tothia fuscella TaxID=1048955 RepID=A0A9P4NWC8_9PEZI|nr:hypothetical protein EJ08DRAFT_58077 [Tothia fuscella]
MIELLHRLMIVGLQDYYGDLLNQDIDTWEAVLTLSEDDLCALGFKLGHRRKLQRYIATQIGYSTDRALPGATISQRINSTNNVSLLQRHNDPNPGRRESLASNSTTTSQNGIVRSIESDARAGGAVTRKHKKGPRPQTKSGSNSESPLQDGSQEADEQGIWEFINF